MGRRYYQVQNDQADQAKDLHYDLFFLGPSDERELILVAFVSVEICVLIRQHFYDSLLEVSTPTLVLFLPPSVCY